MSESTRQVLEDWLAPEYRMYQTFREELERKMDNFGRSRMRWRKVGEGKEGSRSKNCKVVLCCC